MSEATTEHSPDESITLQVHCAANAGKTPKTRFGPVEFASDGLGEVTCKRSDVALLEQLKWLLPADRKEFGFLTPPVSAEARKGSDSGKAPSKAMLSENKQLKTKFDEALAAVDELNVQLDSANAQLDVQRARIADLEGENATLVQGMADAKQALKSKDKKKKNKS